MIEYSNEIITKIKELLNLNMYNHDDSKALILLKAIEDTCSKSDIKNILEYCEYETQVF